MSLNLKIRKERKILLNKSIKKKENKYEFVKELLNEGVPLIFDEDPRIKEIKTYKFSVEIAGVAMYEATIF